MTRRSRFSTARAAFLHSCVANLFITIPSIRNPAERVKLNIQSGQISLAAETFAFLESFLEAAVHDFETLTNPTDFEKLSPFFLSLLISAPDSENDQSGPMNILKDFLQVIKKFVFILCCFSFEFLNLDFLGQKQTRQNVRKPKFC